MTRCPHEDDVVLSFVDGEPRDDSAALADHLAACACCRRAVDQSRKLDALLASRTDTALSDARADALLAFLNRPAPPVARRPVPWGRIAGLAAGLAAGLIVVLGVLALRRPPRPQQVPPSSERTLVPAPAVAALRIPDGASVPRLRRPAPALDGATLAPAFWGDSSAIAPERLLEEARRLRRSLSPLAALGPAERPLPRCPGFVTTPGQGPLARTETAELAAIAAVWILREVRAGRLARDEAWLAADILLATEGALRRGLGRHFQACADVFAPWLAWQRQAGATLGSRYRAEACALTGALGWPVRDRALAVLPWRELCLLAEQARRTGSEPSLKLLVEAWCAAARRSAALADQALGWFEALRPRELELLLALLEARARASPRLADRELATRLRDGLLAAHAADD